MVRWLAGLVTAAVISVFALLLVTGHYVEEGPVLLSLTRTHGVHEGDLLVLLGWVVGLATLLVSLLVPARGRRRDLTDAERDPR